MTSIQGHFSCLGTQLHKLSILSHYSSGSLGCLNGGGQIKASPGESKALLRTVTELYNSVSSHSPFTSSIAERLYADWLEGKNSEKCNRLLYTDYHEVEKLTNALTIKW